MDQRKVVLQESAAMAVGELICSALTVAVFAALGYFRMNVLWGVLVGSLIMTANYFFMAVTINLASDKAEAGQVKQAQNMVQISSVVRLLCMGAALVLGIKLGANVVALLLPIVYFRPILMVWEFFRKKGD